MKRGFDSNRDPNIAKVDLDLIIMGANRGKGFKNKSESNSFLMGTYYKGKIVPISNVSSGITKEIIDEIAKIV